ncbi:MAG: YjgP/YjgQ family permease [Candidatus Hydrogenedentes bacterium]|nr:YjgP/YjgQ family permease [Candidatus Hydrogenedentota bacterium]
MTVISRYNLRLIAVPALMSALVIVFFLTGGAVRTQMRAVMELIPADQIRMWDITRISAFTTPMLSGYVIPITFLLGIMMAFSRLARNSELTAMKAAGIPLKRLVMPVVLLGVLLSGASFFIQNTAQPFAHRHLVSLISRELPLRVTIDLLPAGVMHTFGDWRVYIGSRDGNGVLHDIMVLQPDGEGGANAFYAATARLVRENGQPMLEMRQGYLVPADPTRHFTFDILRKPVPPLVADKSWSSKDGMTLGELLALEDELEQLFAETQALPVAGDLRSVRIHIKNRIAFPLMCLAVALIAAPVGARTRRAGRSYAFGAGLVILCGYFVLRKVAEPPFLASLSLTVLMGQLPNLVLGAAGLFLLSRVDRI